MCYRVVLDCWCVFVCVWLIFVFCLRDIGRYEAEETDNVGISGSLLFNARLWLCFLKEIGSYSSGNMYLFIFYILTMDIKANAGKLPCAGYIYILYIYLYTILEYIWNMTNFKQDAEMFSWVYGWKQLIYSVIVFVYWRVFVHNIHYTYIHNIHRLIVKKKFVLLFSKDALNWQKWQ